MTNNKEDQFNMSDLGASLSTTLSVKDGADLVNDIKNKLQSLAGKHSDVLDLQIVVEVEGVTKEGSKDQDDKKALKYLKDIKWRRIDDPKCFKLEFFFDLNPYFENAAPTKTYHMIDDDEPILEKAIMNQIVWLLGKCLTQKAIRGISFERFDRVGVDVHQASWTSSISGDQCRCARNAKNGLQLASFWPNLEGDDAGDPPCSTSSNRREISKTQVNQSSENEPIDKKAQENQSSDTPERYPQSEDTTSSHEAAVTDVAVTKETCSSLVVSEKHNPTLWIKAIPDKEYTFKANLNGIPGNMSTSRGTVIFEQRTNAFSQLSSSKASTPKRSLGIFMLPWYLDFPSATLLLVVLLGGFVVLMET
ncbi:Nucleosome assembly protein (NAP) [Dillenia turbinata]|uniref:Nucleosome assembly protein (NAP) n=1 Tax=Dillenia turbinata TaxID=194707 RepID=A0AAN8W652_9MAGN